MRNFWVLNDWRTLCMSIERKTKAVCKRNNFTKEDQQTKQWLSNWIGTHKRVLGDLLLGSKVAFPCWIVFASKSVSSFTVHHQRVGHSSWLLRWFFTAQTLFFTPSYLHYNEIFSGYWPLVTCGSMTRNILMILYAFEYFLLFFYV